MTKTHGKLLRKDLPKLFCILGANAVVFLLTPLASTDEDACTPRRISKVRMKVRKEQPVLESCMQVQEGRSSWGERSRSSGGMRNRRLDRRLEAGHVISGYLCLSRKVEGT